MATFLLIAALPLLGQLPLPRTASLVEPLSSLADDSVPASSAAPYAATRAPAATPATATGPRATVSSSLPFILFALWATGAAWGLVSLLRAGVTLRRWKRFARPIAADQLPLSRAALGNCEVRESAMVSVPMVAGILQPCILLPEGLRDRLPREQLALLLMHESIHARRGDTWLVLLQRLIQALYFYNPVVHWMSRAIDRERECSCDDRAIRAARESTVDYASCLVRVTREIASHRAPALAVGAVRGASQLKLRVERLLSRSESEDTRFSWRPVAAASFALFLLAGGLSLSFPQANAADAQNAASQDSTRERARDAGTPVSRALGRELVESAQHGDVESARELIAAGADVDHALDGDGTALIIAARRGDLPFVQLLLEHGAHLDRFSSGDGNPLIMAAAHGHTQVATTLLARGADVNAQDPNDETPLINAARGGHLQLVELLIRSGADVNLAVEASTWRGKELRSPLSEARKGRHRAVIERLQQSGATR